MLARSLCLFDQHEMQICDSAVVLGSVTVHRCNASLHLSHLLLPHLGTAVPGKRECLAILDLEVGCNGHSEQQAEH